MALFDQIISDNTSGSGTILGWVQEELLTLGKQEKIIETKSTVQVLSKLLEQFPQFGLLWHFINEFREYFSPAEKISGEQLIEFTETYTSKWNTAQDNACRNMLRQVHLSGKHILLHSNSSAIHSLFKQLADRRQFPIVWQTYSSPAGEGLIQAEKLGSMGFEIHIIHEDAISNFLPDIDLAVFGADMITEDFFLNKTGTFPISLTCRYFQKPVYVLAEQRKKVNTKTLSPKQLKMIMTEKEKPVREINSKDIKTGAVHNLYFERTPLLLVKSVFLDS